MKKIACAAFAVSLGPLSQAAPIAYPDFSDLSGWQLNGTAATLNPNSGNVLRLTDDLSQAGSAFLRNTISLENQASFSAAFDFRITDPQGISDSDGQGADGIVFVVQTESNRAGGSGGFIGYQGLGTSVGVEFDTWYNGHLDRDGNHVGINMNGFARSVVQQGVKTRMNNGEIWNAWVDYDGVNELLEVRLSENGVRSRDAFLSLNMDLESILGTSAAYIGFTSGTGAAGGDHDIMSLQFRDDFNPIASTASAVPSPGTLALLASGLLGVRAGRGRFRDRQLPRQRRVQ